MPLCPVTRRLARRMLARHGNDIMAQLLIGALCENAHLAFAICLRTAASAHLNHFPKKSASVAPMAPIAEASRASLSAVGVLQAQGFVMERLTPVS
jgi:hypothetical protein